MNKKIILIGILSAVIIAASFFIFNSSEEETPPQENIDVAKNEVVVYVSGQVKTPAVIILEDNGSLRLVDAVRAVKRRATYSRTDEGNFISRHSRAVKRYKFKFQRSD